MTAELISITLILPRTGTAGDYVEALRESVLVQRDAGNLDASCVMETIVTLAAAGKWAYENSSPPPPPHSP